mmetsp:Transcript_23372/g.66591  ORF Transcript_23372/g.66591 Transcript_23372/m.66591 type:complete len:307 (-) Transcript_23372:387-1307(-)
MHPRTPTEFLWISASMSAALHREVPGSTPSLRSTRVAPPETGHPASPLLRPLRSLGGVLLLLEFTGGSLYKFKPHLLLLLLLLQRPRQPFVLSLLHLLPAELLQHPGLRLRLLLRHFLVPPGQAHPRCELPERRRECSELDDHKADAPGVRPSDTAGVHAEEELQQVCPILLPACQCSRGLAAHGGPPRAGAQRCHRIKEEHEACGGFVPPRPCGVAGELPAEALQHRLPPGHLLANVQRPRLCVLGCIGYIFLALKCLLAVDTGCLHGLHVHLGLRRNQLCEEACVLRSVKGLEHAGTQALLCFR